jgi:GTP cyclohydrolase I
VSQKKHPDREEEAILAARLKRQNLEVLTRQWLDAIGEDAERNGLLKTPDRVARAWEFMTSGYSLSVAEVANDAVFPAEGSEMVIVKDIEFYSMCEHHLLPFFGRAHVAYIPGEKILGLSKFARIIDVFSRRLQVQERLTTQVAEAVGELLSPEGVAVMLEGTHLCMAMRGVEKQQSSTVTTSMLGVFRSDARTRNEFLAALQQAPLGRR